jgi:hypothetical protein
MHVHTMFGSFYYECNLFVCCSWWSLAMVKLDRRVGEVEYDGKYKKRYLIEAKYWVFLHNFEDLK